MARRLGMGWLPDHPDFRDYTAQSAPVTMALKRANVAPEPPAKATLPDTVDLRAWCPPVEDQGAIGSCTANAGVGLYEYFQRRATGRHIDGSRLFLYKATRNLLKLEGDTGAYLRSTMGAMALFGVPPEEFWPYDAEEFDVEPPAFCYAFAQNYQALKYFRLDGQVTPKKLCDRIKYYLAAGFPSMFGFTVFSSIWDAGDTGEIPFPGAGDRREGGHAVMAVGYDDDRVIAGSDGETTHGAFLIRNSWGRDWGDDGYGWLPYEFVLREIADDWWTLISGEWMDTGNFGL